jgi:N-acyl homoserine lactone hydrolase
MSLTNPAPEYPKEAGGYLIDILVHGYPGRSVCHGSLGWSTIVLLRGHGHVALIDVGSFGVRHILQQKLKDLGLKPEDVTDVILTHAHYDHMINWTMFSNASIHISGSELDWSLTAPWGKTPVPELYVKELAQWNTLKRIEPGLELLPELVAHHAPGHTPGHLVFVLKGLTRDIIFTGDAAKNRAELLSHRADMSLNEQDSAATIARIWGLWAEKPGSVLVPGHDLPMSLHDGQPVYLGEREAGIKAWFSTDLEQTTEFSIMLDQYVKT